MPPTANVRMIDLSGPTIEAAPVQTQHLVAARNARPSASSTGGKSRFLILFASFRLTLSRADMRAH
jgi:hypothetical protein